MLIQPYSLSTPEGLLLLTHATSYWFPNELNTLFLLALLGFVASLWT